MRRKSDNGKPGDRARKKMATVAKYDFMVNDYNKDPRMKKVKEIGKRKPYYLPGKDDEEKEQNNE